MQSRATWSLCKAMSWHCSSPRDLPTSTSSRNAALPTHVRLRGSTRRVLSVLPFVSSLPSLRLGPGVRRRSRSIALRATSSCRNSSAFGVHDSQHQVAQLPTVASSKRRRRLIETFWFSNSGFMLQNILHPAAILFLISCVVTSIKLSTVPSNARFASSSKTSTENPSSIVTSPRRKVCTTLV